MMEVEVEVEVPVLREGLPHLSRSADMKEDLVV